MLSPARGTALLVLLVVFTNGSCSRVAGSIERLVHGRNHNVTRALPPLIESCATYADVDEWQPSTGDTCYIRMYRCGEAPKGGMKNANAGDVGWAIGGCRAYGGWLHVWRVEVKRSMFEERNKQFHFPLYQYSKCNEGQCEAEDFGWLRVEQPNVPTYTWFSLPDHARGSEYQVHCLEKTIAINACLDTYTGDRSEANDDTVTKFKEAAFASTPAQGCESHSCGAHGYHECQHGPSLQYQQQHHHHHHNHAACTSMKAVTTV